MRLTPFWCCLTSAGSPGEPPEDAETDTGSGVTIYHPNSEGGSIGGSGADEGATQFVPDSNSELVSVLDEMETPVTVDEVTDQLIHPARPSVETWAAVHERLHQQRLPELDTTGHIEFDEDQGLVERQTVRADATSRRSSSGGKRFSIKFLFVVFLVLSVSALAVAFVATTGGF